MFTLVFGVLQVSKHKLQIVYVGSVSVCLWIGW